MISGYHPTHTECGKKQQKLNDWDQRKLLLVGHVMRYCDDCRRPWLLTISEEEKATLFGVDADRADITSPEIVSLVPALKSIDPTIRNTTKDWNAVLKKKSPGRSPYTSRGIIPKQG